MRYLVDLHTHSTASDGQYSPSELVRLAKKRGLSAMALTDHDSARRGVERQRISKFSYFRILL